MRRVNARVEGRSGCTTGHTLSEDDASGNTMSLDDSAAASALAAAAASCAASAGSSIAPSVDGTGLCCGSLNRDECWRTTLTLAMKRCRSESSSWWSSSFGGLGGSMRERGVRGVRGGGTFLDTFSLEVAVAENSKHSTSTGRVAAIHSRARPSESTGTARRYRRRCRQRMGPTVNGRGKLRWVRRPNAVGSTRPRSRSSRRGTTRSDGAASLRS